MSEFSATLQARGPSTEETTQSRILIIDDEAAIRESLETLLSLEGYTVEMAGDGERGLAMLDQQSYDLVLLDLALPGQSGIEVLPRIHERQPQLPVIMITAFGTVNNVVDAIRAGAQNFVQKPWDNEKLLADIRASIARFRAEEENVHLKRALKQRYNFSNIVGKSDAMLRIFDLVAQVAPSRSTVLIQGESGTGKELIAKALHANSTRRDKPFIPVNTGAVPSELLESTLFGHVKGAFTSAIASKKGLFEVANGGTLFLDEIGTMGLDTSPNSCAFCRTENSCTSAASPKSRLTSASSPPPTAISARPCAKASSAKISSIVSTSSPSICRPSAPAAKTSRRWPPTSSSALPPKTNSPRVSSHPKPCVLSWTMTGPAMSANSRTPSNAASSSRPGSTIGVDLLPSQLSGRNYTSSLLEHNPDSSLFDILEDIERRLIMDKLENCHWNQTDAAEQFRIPLSTLNQKIKRLSIEIKKRVKE